MTARKNTELIAAVEALKSTIALLVEDVATVVGSVEQIRNSVHDLRGSMQTIANEQIEIGAHIRELREHFVKVERTAGYLDNRLELIQTQMVEGFRKLGADIREVRMEGRDRGRERLETR